MVRYRKKGERTHSDLYDAVIATLPQSNVPLWGNRFVGACRVNTENVVILQTGENHLRANWIKPLDLGLLENKINQGVKRRRLFLP
jgi:hypothetical protein